MGGFFSMDENKKRFLHIVQQLKQLIEQQKIQTGDKLPSERVLSEQMQVGRSSIREALRSLELLGLIETKHGGGTYLSDSQHHKLVEIVGSFIIKNDQSIKEIKSIRQMHEKEAIASICLANSNHYPAVWDSFFVRVELNEEVERGEILKEIIILSENRLALKIWLQLAAYCYKLLKENVTLGEKPYILTMLKAIQMNYSEEAIEAYDNWMHHLNQAYKG